MLSVRGAAGRRVGVQRSPLGSQPQRRSAAGVAPRRCPLSTGGRQRLPTRAEAGGSGSNWGGVSSDEPSPIPWTQEQFDTLLAAVNVLGGAHKANPWAVVEAVKWPGLTEAQVAGVLRMLGPMDPARGAAAGAVEPGQNGGAGGRREKSGHPGDGEASRLHKLVAEGRLEEVQRLLQQGTNGGLCIEDSDGRTPLHVAAMTGNIECICLLVQHGADVEARGSYDYTPLQVAARNGQAAACKELVALGASLGSRDSKGCTALEVAAMGDVSGEGVRALVQLGASPDERDSRLGGTPLHTAALCGAVGADRALLELGADVGAANFVGVRPLHSAAVGSAPGTIAVAQLLVQAGADVSARDSFGRTPLHFAAMRGKVPFIHFLLSAGADHEAKDNYGFTPAELAAQEGQAEAMAILDTAVTQMQGPHQGPQLAGTPQRPAPLDVNEAVRQFLESGGSLDVLCTLLQQGLPPDTLVNGSFTTLHEAADVGALGHIRMLVHHGAALEYQDKTFGHTALHRAAGQQQPAACRELVAVGAKLDARDNWGRTPLMLAAGNDESGDCVRVLVQAGANVQCTDARGAGALDYAAGTGLLGPAKVLLEAGAAVTGDAQAGMWALHYAVESPNGVDMVRLLLAAGAAVSAVDKDGTTPLHLAAVAGNAEVARLLLQAGARANARDSEGRTPAQVAAQEGNVEVEFLLRQAA